MSDYEHHVGKLTLVTGQLGRNIQDVAKIILELNKKIIPVDYENHNFVDQLNNDLNGKFICIKDKIYKMDDITIDPDDDIMKAMLNPDGSINYEVKFYNGGCGLDEALEMAINKIAKEPSKEKDPTQIDLIDSIIDVESESNKPTNNK